MDPWTAACCFSFRKIFPKHHGTNQIPWNYTNSCDNQTILYSKALNIIEPKEPGLFGWSYRRIIRYRFLAFEWVVSGWENLHLPFIVSLDRIISSPKIYIIPGPASILKFQRSPQLRAINCVVNKSHFAALFTRNHYFPCENIFIPSWSDHSCLMKYWQILYWTQERWHEMRMSLY